MPSSSFDRVHVAVRVRASDNSRQSTRDPSTTSPESFDAYLPPSASQSDVFDAICSPDFLDSIAEGYNACVFAYGQTGSGKSFTVTGSAEQPGLIPRLAKTLFEANNCPNCPRDESRPEEKCCHRFPQIFAEAQYLEIYNERVRDLLTDQNCRIAEYPGVGVVPLGAVKAGISNEADLADVIELGTSNRAVAETLMNGRSSRSHAVLILFLKERCQDCCAQRSTSLCQTCTASPLFSTLYLVDLAGSERVDKSGVTGSNLRETGAINQSLSALGTVVSRLLRNSFPPFRMSKLTHLLKPALSGESKTWMLATVSDDPAHSAETLSTLQFAERMRGIKCQARKNVTNQPTGALGGWVGKTWDIVRGSLTQFGSGNEDVLELERKMQSLAAFRSVISSEALELDGESPEEFHDLVYSSLQRSSVKINRDEKKFPCLVNASADPALDGQCWLELPLSIGGDTSLTGSLDLRITSSYSLTARPRNVLSIPGSNRKFGTISDSLVLTMFDQSVRVAVNGQVLSSPEYSRQLEDGDELEIGDTTKMRVQTGKATKPRVLPEVPELISESLDALCTEAEEISRFLYTAKSLPILPCDFQFAFTPIAVPGDVEVVRMEKIPSAFEYWSIDKFKERLESMKECRSQVHDLEFTRSLTTGEVADPWAEGNWAAYETVARKLQASESALEGSLQALHTTEAALQATEAALQALRLASSSDTEGMVLFDELAEDIKALCKAARKFAKKVGKE